MKIDRSLNQGPPVLNPSVSHLSSTGSFEDIFREGALMVSSQNAVSFDAAGLLGVARTPSVAGTPAASIRDLPSSVTMATPVRLPDLLQDNRDKVMPTPEPASPDFASRIDHDNHPLAMKPSLWAAHTQPSVAFGGAVAASPLSSVPSFAGPVTVARDVFNPVVSQMKDALRAGAISTRAIPAAGPSETNEPAEPTPLSDTAPRDAQPNGASDPVSVIVTETADGIDIMAAAPEYSPQHGDEARQKLREALADIVLTTGVRLRESTLNGKNLAHSGLVYSGPDRRMSWQYRQ